MKDELLLDTSLDVKNQGTDNPDKILNTNPFIGLTIAKPSSEMTGGELLANVQRNNPYKGLKTETLYNAKPYIQNGFNLTDSDIAITPDLEQNLSRTQTNLDRLGNRAVKGLTNFASMLLINSASNPLEGIDGKIDNLDDGSWQSDVFKKTQEINNQYVNYETSNDKSDKFMQQLYNWLPFTDSTKSIGGTLLESGGFILGSMGGTVVQSALAGLVTEGLGVLPTFANGLQKLLNSSKYLKQGLKYSKLAEKAAANLSKVITSGDLTEKSAELLQKLYFMQQGAYGEALFEGLEGKEKTIKDLSDQYQDLHGFAPTGNDLKEIEKTGLDAGQTRAYINNALLLFSGAGELATVFKTKKALRDSAEELSESMGSRLNVDGTTVNVRTTSDFKFNTKNEWWNKGFGKGLKTGAEKAINLYNPKTAGQVFVSQSVPEGFEEFSQTAIDKGVSSYYESKYNHNDENVTDSIKKGLKQSMSKEGFEAFFSGAISGGTIALMGHYFRQAQPNVKTAKADYGKKQDDLAIVYNQLQSKLNNLSPRDRKIVEQTFKTESIQGDLLDRVNRSNITSSVVDLSNRTFDDTEIQSIQSKGLYNIAMPYVKHGNIDILKDQFNGFLEYSDEDFKNVFGEVVGKSKNEVIEGHINEFKKINDSYSKVKNAFNTNVKYQEIKSTDTPDIIANKIKNNENLKNYTELVQDLAFDYYNIDNLKSSSKQIESELGNLMFLKDYIKPELIDKAVIDNKQKVKDLDLQIESLILTDNTSKLLKKDLQNQRNKLVTANEYLEKGNFEFEGFNNNLKENVVNPYLESIEGKQIDNLELTDSLNKLYQLENINVQVKKIQKKLDKVLNLENPVDYYKNKQYKILKNLATQQIQANPVVAPVIIPEVDLEVEKKRLADLAVLAEKKRIEDEILRLEAERLEAERIAKEASTENDVIIEINSDDNIESKLDETTFIFDEDGNELSLYEYDSKGVRSNNPKTEEIIKFRNELINIIVNKGLIKDFEYKVIKTGSKKVIKMADEGDYLFKTTPDNVLLVYANEMNIASVSLDDNNLFVPVNLAKKQLSKKTIEKLVPVKIGSGKKVQTVYRYDELLNTITEDDFKNLLGTPLFKSNANLQNLRKSLQSYKNTKDLLKQSPENFANNYDVKVFSRKTKDAGKIKLANAHFYNEFLTPRIKISEEGIVIYNIDDLEDFNEEQFKKEIYEINDKQETKFKGNLVAFKQRDVDGTTHYVLESYIQGDYSDVNKNTLLDKKVEEEFYVQLSNPDLNKIKSNIEAIGENKSLTVNMNVLFEFLKTNEFLPKLDFFTDNENNVAIRLFSRNLPETKFNIGEFKVTENSTTDEVIKSIKEALSRSQVLPTDTKTKIIRNKGSQSKTNLTVDDFVITSHNENIPEQYFTTAYFKILPSEKAASVNNTSIINPVQVVDTTQQDIINSRSPDITYIDSLSDLLETIYGLNYDLDLQDGLVQEFNSKKTPLEEVKTIVTAIVQERLAREQNPVIETNQTPVEIVLELPIANIADNSIIDVINARRKEEFDQLDYDYDNYQRSKATKEYYDFVKQINKEYDAEIEALTNQETLPIITENPVINSNLDVEKEKMLSMLNVIFKSRNTKLEFKSDKDNPKLDFASQTFEQLNKGVLGIIFTALNDGTYSEGSIISTLEGNSAFKRIFVVTSIDGTALAERKDSIKKEVEILLKKCN